MKDEKEDLYKDDVHCMMCGKNAEEAKDPNTGFVAWEEVDVGMGEYEDWMYCFYCKVDTFKAQKD